MYLFFSLNAMILLLVNSSKQISLPSSSTYVAGVVEFFPKMYGSSIDTVNNRTREYITIMESSEANDVDIIIFPEATLTTILTPAVLPRITDKISPCDYTNYTIFLHDLSCAARNTRKYLVVNLYMQSDCTEDEIVYGDVESECPESNIRLYNTNVVFDRNGTVISIYRKYNLFGESSITKPNVADIAVFDTDFGVRFGHFICFDLLFDKPALDLIKLGITDIIFPTMWFSGMPFLTAVQIQQSWAQRFDVNLLAAGASYPQAGSTGSGIYAGKNGALDSIMVSEPTTLLIVATIEKKSRIDRDNPNKRSIIINKDNKIITEHGHNNIIGSRFTESMLPLFMIIDDLGNYTNKYLNFSGAKESTTNFSLTYNEDFKCDFNIEVIEPDVIPMVHYEYYAIAYYGNRSFSGQAESLVFTCAIIPCTNKSFSSCALRFDAGAGELPRYTFNQLNVNLKFKSEDYVIPMPNSLTAKIMPLPINQYEYIEIGNFNQQNPNESKEVSMKLLNSHNDLITFGIYGRAFPNSNSSNSSSSRIDFKWMLSIISVILSLYVVFL